MSILVPSTIPVVEDKSLETQYQVSYVPVEARWTPSLSKSSPDQISPLR